MTRDKGYSFMYKLLLGFDIFSYLFLSGIFTKYWFSLVFGSPWFNLVFIIFLLWISYYEDEGPEHDP